MYQSNRSFNILLGQLPWAFEFKKKLCQITPSPAGKLLKCPHPHVPSGEKRGLTCISLTAAGNRAQKIIVCIVKTILIRLHI